MLALISSMRASCASRRYLELNKIYRQSDPAFISLLNNLRDSRVTPADVDTLNTYTASAFKPGKDEQYINLTTHNFKADRINTARLKNSQPNNTNTAQRSKATSCRPAILWTKC